MRNGQVVGVVLACLGLAVLFILRTALLRLLLLVIEFLGLVFGFLLVVVGLAMIFGGTLIRRRYS